MSKSRNNLIDSSESVETHIFKDRIPNLSTRADLLRGDRVHRDHSHEVVFMIQQRNMEELIRILEDVSDPSSLNYGQHMTKDEVVQLTSNPDGLDAVTAYLVTNGATVVSATLHGEYVTAAAPIAVWERLLNTEFFTFHQTQVDGRIETLVRAETYSIPRELGPHVMHVMNTVDTPLMTHRVPHTTIRSPEQTEKSRFHTTGDWQTVSPRKIKEFYNVSNYRGSDLSTQAVYETSLQNYSPRDLKQFQSTFGLKQQGAFAINGQNNDTVCVVNSAQCGESNLDLQYIMGVSQGSPTTHWYIPGDFLTWLVLVANTVNPPLVLSISWGAIEDEVSTSIHDAFSHESAKLGARGVTIVVATGDDGANSEYVRKSATKCGYKSSFPSSNPYVVSVGATSGVQNEPYGVEVVAQSDTNSGSSITSGGGFSAYYPAPSWQESAVSAYFKAAAAAGRSPVAGYTVGRGYPDVSVAGVEYTVIIGGKTTAVSGTSAATPVVAAFFSNINAARMAIGKGPVGWVNPALYAHGASFMNDITSGHNKCVLGGTCCPQGYYAGPGWDPACGLGSPNYGKMHQVLVALGGEINAALPTSSPSVRATGPSYKPSLKPSSRPSISFTPTFAPVFTPTKPPTQVPTLAPTVVYYRTSASTTIAVAATCATVGFFLLSLMGIAIYYIYWKYCKAISKHAVYATDAYSDRGKDRIPEGTSEDSNNTVNFDSEPPSPAMSDQAPNLSYHTSV